MCCNTGERVSLGGTNGMENNENESMQNSFGMHRYPPPSSIPMRLFRTIQATYGRWTYSYMNPIFTKGALQKNDKSIEAQLTQDDLLIFDGCQHAWEPWRDNRCHGKMMQQFWIRNFGTCTSRRITIFWRHYGYLSNRHLCQLVFVSWSLWVHSWVYRCVSCAFAGDRSCIRHH